MKDTCFQYGAFWRVHLLPESQNKAYMTDPWVQYSAFDQKTVAVAQLVGSRLMYKTLGSSMAFASFAAVGPVCSAAASIFTVWLLA